MRSDRIKLKSSDELIPVIQDEPRSPVTRKIALIAPIVLLTISGTFFAAAGIVWERSRQINNPLIVAGLVSLSCAALARCLFCHHSEQVGIGEDLV